MARSLTWRPQSKLRVWQRDRADAGRGTVCHSRLHEPAVRVPWQDVVALSCLRRDSEEDADLPCARGSCLASRVASCSCELLTDGRWGQSWLE